MYGNDVAIKGKKFALCTLGCKVNQYESDAMAALLEGAGGITVPFSEKADIYIVNTCSVTNMAERKSRQMLHRAKKRNENAVVVAVGCYVQAAEEKLREELGIDLLVGNSRKKEIVRIIEEYLAKKRAENAVTNIAKEGEYERLALTKPKEHCRAYIKVQDGCNNFCSYCIIPYVRGRVRSRRLSDVLSEAEEMAGQGIKEIVLTGINLSSYQDGENGLLELILAVCGVEKIERVRLGSLEPRVITEHFLRSISKNKKVCPHFHLSLQSACNATLERMNRKYTIEEYMEKCAMIRSFYDRPAITTDIIVGFPGETDEEFDTTKQNLNRLNLYEMHIFKYSKRDRTVAARMPMQVKDEIKEKRSSELLAMAERNKALFEESFAGEELSILVEEYGKENGAYWFQGHTDRYIMVKKEGEEKFCKNSVNKIVTVKL